MLFNLLIHFAQDMLNTFVVSILLTWLFAQLDFDDITNSSYNYLHKESGQLIIYEDFAYKYSALLIKI